MRHAPDVEQCRMLKVPEPVAVLLQEDVDDLPRVVEPVLVAGHRQGVPRPLGQIATR
jgi:hypothetical protein